MRISRVRSSQAMPCRLAPTREKSGLPVAHAYRFKSHKRLFKKIKFVEFFLLKSKEKEREETEAAVTVIDVN